jgi:7,8-dihydroneopterin aldolase/epimerase/oxygenase
MSRISINELEVHFNVGVTDEERAKPQRLLISVDMSHDLTSAAISDRIEKSIDYQRVAEAIIKFGESRSWKLLEKLASNLADLILMDFRPQAVMVEVKKFSIPQAKYVSVSLTKSRTR